MTDRPIIFSGPMVRALLEGRKTQTRRVLNPQPVWDHGALGIEDKAGRWVFCANTERGFGEGLPRSRFKMPYAPGDRLYVREAHSLHRAHGQDFTTPANDHGKRWGPWSGLPIAVSPDKTQVAYYREGFDRSGPPRWRPSIHMPRWASRLTLPVTEVRVQRLQDISETDAKAEGAPAVGAELCPPDCEDIRSHVWGFHDLWNSLHGRDAWDANPWVVAVTFTVDRRNIDSIT